MNSIENYIKYLDDQLSKKEKLLFENQLKENKQLKKEFGEFSKLYNSTKQVVEVDDRYFSKTIYSAKEAAVKESQSGFKLSYVMPVLILSMLAIIYFSFNNSKPKYNFNTLFETFTSNNELTENLFESSLSEQETIILEDNELVSLYGEQSSLDDDIYEFVEENFNASEINSNFINQLTEDDINNIYNVILNKKL